MPKGRAEVTRRVFRYTFNSEPDSQGRRQYTLEWEEPDGVFRAEIGKDGKPVGYRRGQVFFTNPDEHFKELRKRGHLVIPARGGRR